MHASVIEFGVNEGTRNSKAVPIPATGYCGQLGPQNGHHPSTSRPEKNEGQEEFCLDLTFRARVMERIC